MPMAMEVGEDIAGSSGQVLAVQDLRVGFRTEAGALLRAVDGIDLHVGPDETVALVGESGSGKSVAALAVARLVGGSNVEIAGRIRLAGEDVSALSEAEWRRRRGRVISYVFQDPSGSLNPVQRVGSQIVEAIRTHRPGGGARDEAVELMQRVGLPDPARRFGDYPHQFSGGMQQRIMIAMALACRPRLLVADEPTTALDVTIQAQIFRLLAELRGQFRMSALLITHNLGLVAWNAGRVYVMYAGRIMESGPVQRVLRQPAHPYTRGLLAAVPRLRAHAGRMVGIEGAVPPPGRLPAGCRFHPRCHWAAEACRAGEPGMDRVEEGHEVRCHFWKSRM
jgi:oligopeptide/dipeptide ABC transporter ATP-binding protein